MITIKGKRIAIPLIILGLAISGAALWQTGIVKADNASTDKTISERLAEKLNISNEQVSTAMDQIKSENQAQKKAEMSAKLDKAVVDGAITAEQKQKLLDKMTEMQQKRQQEKTDMQNWVKDSGIDFSKLKEYGIGGLGLGGKGGHGRGGCQK